MSHINPPGARFQIERERRGSALYVTEIQFWQSVSSSDWTSNHENIRRESLPVTSVYTRRSRQASNLNVYVQLIKAVKSLIEPQSALLARAHKGSFATLCRRRELTASALDVTISYNIYTSRYIVAKILKLIIITTRFKSANLANVNYLLIVINATRCLMHWSL